MSDYFDSEASVSSGEEGPLRSKKPRPENPVSSENSDEEEELPDEEEICRKEGQGWIVNDDEDEGGEGSDDGADDEDDDVLDEDDYDVILENGGINVRPKTKKRRLVIDDEDEADVLVSRASKEARSREAIAREIFEEDEGEAEDHEGDSLQAAPSFAPKSDEESDDSDGMVDFIVNDAPADERDTNQKRRTLHKDPSLQQAQSIFGVDFDFDEFEQFDKRGSDTSVISDYEDEDEEVNEGRRKGKREPKMAPQDQIYELFDPTDLARNFYSPEDERIRCTDIPERFQLRAVPVRRLDSQSVSYKDDLVELEKEAEWIYNTVFKEGPSKKPITVMDNIFEVLKLFKESLSEVPFIAFYRKECIKKELNINDLWCIYEFDEKWEVLQQRRKGLIRQLKSMSKYLETRGQEVGNKDESSLKSEGLVQLITMTENATSLEEVQDVRLKYLLHYAGHMHDMLVWEGKDVDVTKAASHRKDEDLERRSDDGDEDEDDEEYDPSYGIKSLNVEEEEEAAMAVKDAGEREKKKSVEEENREAGKVVCKREPGAGVLTTIVDPMTGRRIRQRQVRTTAAYEVAQRAGVGKLAEKFGLSAEQFADNVRDHYRRHEVNQCIMLPWDAAADFVCPQFPEAATALRAARYMLAFEISREPVVRQLARINLSTQAVLDLKPTYEGMRLIDDCHPLAAVKFLKNKPLSELMGDVTYLHIHNALRDGLVTMKVHVAECQQRGLSLLHDLEHYFHQDEFSASVQAWNEQRSLVLKEAIEQFLQPHIFKEMQEKLLEASQKAVVKLCAQKLFKCIKVAPYVVDDHRCGGNGDGDGKADDRKGGSSRHRQSSRYLSDGGESSISNTVWPKPVRVLAFALKDDKEVTKAMVTVVRLDADGEVVDFANLPGLLHSTRSQREEFRKRHDDDVRRLSHFITRSRPQAIVIGCNARRSLIVKEEVQRVVEKLTMESRLSSRPNIELMDTELAEVYARSEAATSSLPSSYSVLLRQAISLGRRLQDPLAEFAHLFNSPDMDILGVRWHAVQDELPREMLLKALEIEFINRTNEVGVDVNRCILHPHTANLLQFVAGLGPRKAFYMIKLLKLNKVFLTNRELLAKVLRLGPHVAINCAGFIKIDTTSARDLPDSGDNIEILDSTRVHPESYDLARQMAVDALEYDDDDGDDNDPTAALEEIVQSPARLRELDLDAFAEELKRQDHGDKHITLYDIRKELNHRYRDLRDPFESLTPEQIFSLATHETPETLHKGSLVNCQVVSVVTKKPRPEQLDQANPTKNEVTGLWKCPFCRRDNFRQLNEMWSHFDSSDCPGQPVGLRVQLENGISGFISLRLIDNPVEKTLDNAAPGTILQAKVLKIDITKFSVELTLRSSDIQDERHMGLSRRDAFFDYVEEEEEERRQMEEEAKAKARATQTYVNRVIFHPHFKNITYNQLIAMNPVLEVGAIVIRPSRRSTDHLTVSLKVDDGIFKHIDVIEKDKAQSFGLGKRLLIGDESFEDLDEIVARYMEPMVSLIREIYAHKCYSDSQGGKREMLIERLRKEKDMSRAKIPYLLSSTAAHPGYFLLAYMPSQTPRFEMFSVKPEGLKFRHHIFPSLDRMIGWFKSHYNERSHHGYQQGMSGVGDGRATGTLDGNSSSRTPRMDDFFNLPIPHSDVILKPL